MKLTSQKAKSLLALAGLFIASVSAQAATTYTAGDLLMGFRQTGAGASTSSLVVNLGQASAFRDATGTLTPVLGTAGLDADLTAAFGANWFTSNNVRWGIVGAVGASSIGSDPGNTLYSSFKEISNVANSAGYEQKDYGTQDYPSTAIQTLGSVFNNKTITGNVALVQSNTAANTWNGTQTAKASNAFSNAGVWTAFEAIVGSASSNLDLSRAVADNVNGGGTFGSIEGTFSIASNGAVTFAANAAVVPEPGRVAFLGFGLVGLVLRRRRR